ncbi:MAG: hypothetical protein K2H46_00685 [Muribaculaceae bacterium]|nr:hypothetical protein [Muribaculaceae bacterium]
MNPSGHSLFISTPISVIIKEANKACMSLGTGIEIHPLAAYIMQTTFLRLTGASEQKLKCFCWEVASFDYEFRYEMLRSPLGECSSIQDKSMIFKSIWQSLKRYDVHIEFSDAEKNRIITMATTELLLELQASPLAAIFDKEYLEFKQYINSKPIKKTLFCNYNGKNLSFLEEVLQDYYKECVYKMRNRYAHNLTSYQLNVPTLSQLAKNDSYKSNHFRMISNLILIDGIFMTLFDKFKDLRSFHSY